MGLESYKYSESEKNKKESYEEDKKKSREKILKQERKKGEIREHIYTEEALIKFKGLLKEHKLNLSSADLKNIEKVVSGEDFNTDEIEYILNKIDEIWNNEDIDKYLPKEKRVKKEEYKKAIINDIFRVQIIDKIDDILGILAKHISPDTAMGLNLFSGYMLILDKNLISLQENHIDIKNNLESIEPSSSKKTSKKDLSIWERFLMFLKRIFLGK